MGSLYVQQKAEAAFVLHFIDVHPLIARRRATEFLHFDCATCAGDDDHFAPKWLISAAKMLFNGNATGLFSLSHNCAAACGSGCHGIPRRRAQKASFSQKPARNCQERYNRRAYRRTLLFLPINLEPQIYCFLSLNERHKKKMICALDLVLKYCWFMYFAKAIFLLILMSVFFIGI